MHVLDGVEVLERSGTAAASRRCRAGCRPAAGAGRRRAARRSRTRARRPGGRAARLAAQRSAQCGHTSAIDLDRRRARRPRASSGAVMAPRPGPTSTMRSPGRRRDGAHDALDRPGIVQEVLAVAFLGARIQRRDRRGTRREFDARGRRRRTGCPGRARPCRRGRAPCRGRPRCA